MELKIVKKPMQGDTTKSEDIQYPGETWCVNTYICREGDGGMNMWFKKIEEIKPDIIYLYDIKSWKDKIVIGQDEKDWIEDVVYVIRYEFKKF